MQAPIRSEKSALYVTICRGCTLPLVLLYFLSFSGAIAFRLLGRCPWALHAEGRLYHIACNLRSGVSLASSLSPRASGAPQSGIVEHGRAECCCEMPSRNRNRALVRCDFVISFFICKSLCFVHGEKAKGRESWQTLILKVFLFSSIYSCQGESDKEKPWIFSHLQAEGIAQGDQRIDAREPDELACSSV